VFVGSAAGYTNTTGNYNVAVGRYALGSNTTGGSSTAIGFEALNASTGGANTAVGRRAGYGVTTGQYNTLIGHQVQYSGTSAARNTIVGYNGGNSLTSGSQNTFVGANDAAGYGVGHYITTGSKNTIIGAFDGNQNGLDIRTSSNNIVLSDGDGNPRVWVTNTGRLDVGNYSGYITSGDNARWYLANGSSGYFHRFYFGGVEKGSITLGGAGVNYNTSSDYRLKENVVELTGATSRLKQLQPKRFNFISDPDVTVDGFLAHEVQSVIPEAVIGEKDGTTLDDNGNVIPQYQGVDQSKLVPLLVATIKELEARITALENA